MSMRAMLPLWREEAVEPAGFSPPVCLPLFFLLVVWIRGRGGSRRSRLSSKMRQMVESLIIHHQSSGHHPGPPSTSRPLPTPPPTPLARHLSVPVLQPAMPCLFTGMANHSPVGLSLKAQILLLLLPRVQLVCLLIHRWETHWALKGVRSRGPPHHTHMPHRETQKWHESKNRKGQKVPGELHQTHRGGDAKNAWDRIEGLS